MCTNYSNKFVKISRKALKWLKKLLINVIIKLKLYPIYNFTVIKYFSLGGIFRDEIFNVNFKV